ncbi:MAG: acetate--CoA ligase family protein [Bacteroidota bacterium]|nr:acetate--CoA ligase family protein [Bacteroidota bacterium]
MINQQLLDPQSIVVVGGSEDVTKPGGKILKNIIDGGYQGKLYVLNPKAESIQGIKTYQDQENLPDTELAIIAIAAKYCPLTVEFLAKKKGTRAFIVISAGFGEESEEGALFENRMLTTVEETGACLIGPNCIGFMNHNYYGVFTTPLPKPDPKGIDFISGSGATAVYIMESGMIKGLTFASVYSVGNSTQVGVEDVLEYMDENYREGISPGIKLLYIENVGNPNKLLKHAASLVRKGCKIAAIKAGSTEAGSRAASSHTGALASPDTAVDALFRKAGIVRCFGREELTTVASIFQHKIPQGKNIAVITHAGGPAVMLTDALSDGGFRVPQLSGGKADALLEKLHPGSSVSNPIDFLATGTAQQLGDIIEACENDFDEIDAMVVIFGSPGLSRVYDVYELLDRKMKTCKKPLYPVLPSLINAREEIEGFLEMGHVNFPDEVIFARALSLITKTLLPPLEDDTIQVLDKKKIRLVIQGAESGYLKPDQVGELLDAAGIARVKERAVTSLQEALKASLKIGFPLVMKVIGPLHKSDVGGVVLNIRTEDEVRKHFTKLINIPDTNAVLMQAMKSGIELFAGAKRDEKFGHLILGGLGGIFIEILKDVSSSLVPLHKEEALDMITSLKGYKMIQGVRGMAGVDESKFSEVLVRLSELVLIAPEIIEMDLNPLLGEGDNVFAVDARIRIE